MSDRPDNKSRKKVFLWLLVLYVGGFINAILGELIGLDVIRSRPWLEKILATVYAPLIWLINLILTRFAP